MKAGKVEPTLKSFKNGKVAQQCINEYFNLFTNIYTLYLKSHTNKISQTDLYTKIKLPFWKFFGLS